MYVNLALRDPGRHRRARAVVDHAPDPDRPRFDLPGTLTASAGLFALVYGFSQRRDHELERPADRRRSCAAGVALLGAFVAIQQRSEHPLLPLRVVLDRTRGGSFVAFASRPAGIFGVFLFLTYYLQQTLGYSPVQHRPGVPADGRRPDGHGDARHARLAAALRRAAARAGRHAARRGGMFLLTRLGVDSTYAATSSPRSCRSGSAWG